MTTIVLDSSPLAMIVHRGGTPTVDACKQWFAGHIASGTRIILPEIADYEVRRELVRLAKTNSIADLDYYVQVLEYLPITTDAMRLAADLWAQVRQQGRPTADPKEIDGDVILAAQAILLGALDTVVATTNVGHLSRFVAARHWQDVI